MLSVSLLAAIALTIVAPLFVGETRENTQDAHDRHQWADASEDLHSSPLLDGGGIIAQVSGGRR